MFPPQPSAGCSNANANANHPVATVCVLVCPALCGGVHWSSDSFKGAARPIGGDQSCDRKWNLKTPLRSSSGRSASCRENERWRATVAGGVAVWLLLFLLSMQQVRASTCWRLIGAVIDGGRRPQPATQHKVAHLSPRCICMLAARLWQFVSTPAAAPRRKRTDQSGL